MGTYTRPRLKLLFKILRDGTNVSLSSENFIILSNTYSCTWMHIKCTEIQTTSVTSSLDIRWCWGWGVYFFFGIVAHSKWNNFFGSKFYKFFLRNLTFPEGWNESIEFMFFCNLSCYWTVFQPFSYECVYELEDVPLKNIVSLTYNNEKYRKYKEQYRKSEKQGFNQFWCIGKSLASTKLKKFNVPFNLLNLFI